MAGGKKKKSKQRPTASWETSLNLGQGASANALLDELLGREPAAVEFTPPERRRRPKGVRFRCEERNHPGVNVLEGLRLFKESVTEERAAELVAWVEASAERGLRGELPGQTFIQSSRTHRGNGRQVLQYGAFYNFSAHNIEPEVEVEPIPPLVEQLIDDFTEMGVLPADTRPDTVIVNVYNVGDFIPPHIDHEVYPRPFCTLSLLSAAPMLLGTHIRALGGGEFRAPFRTTLPVRSVLVFRGNSADLAKHCVPPVAERRISITLRRMPEFARAIVAKRRARAALAALPATPSAAGQPVAAASELGASVWDPAARACAESRRQHRALAKACARTEAAEVTASSALAVDGVVAGGAPQLRVEHELRRRAAVRRLQAALEKLCTEHLSAGVCRALPLHTKATLRNGNALWERFLLCWCCGNGGGGGTGGDDDDERLFGPERLGDASQAPCVHTR